MILASSSNSLKLWNCDDDFSSLQTFNNGLQDTHSIVGLSWNQDGKYLATLDSKNLSLYGVNSQSAICTEVISHFVKPLSMSFSNTASHYLAISVNGREVWIWDFKEKSKKKKFTLPGHLSSVTNIAFNVNDSHLIAGTSDGQGVLLSNSNNLINTPVKLFNSKEATTDLQFSLNNRFLIGAGSDHGSISFMDIKSNTNIQRIQRAHSAPVSGIAFSPVNGLLMTSVGYDKKFNSYSLQSKSEVMSFESISPLSAICFFPCGGKVALGTMRGEMLIYDLRNVTKPYVAIEASQAPIFKLAIQPKPLPVNLSSKKGISVSKKKPELRSVQNLKKTSQHIKKVTPPKAKSLSEPIVNEPLHRSIDDFEILSPVNKENKSPIITKESPVKIAASNKNNSRSSDLFLSPLKDGTQTEMFSTDYSKVFENASPLSTPNKNLFRALDSSIEHLSFKQNSLVSENATESNTSKCSLNNSIVSEKVSGVGTSQSPAARNVRESIQETATTSKITTETKEKLLAEMHENAASTVPLEATGNKVDIELIQNYVSDELRLMQMNINEKFMNMHWNMIKYNCQLKKEILSSIQSHSINEELLYENQQLREEIKRLKSTF